MESMLYLVQATITTTCNTACRESSWYHLDVIG